MPKIPLIGDAEAHSTDVKIRPSSERMPFGPSGELLPNGPELPLDYQLAPDIKRQPWRRARGDEWTDLAVRDGVRAWLVTFLAARPWAAPPWEIVERATIFGAGARLRSEENFLLIRITRRSDGRVLEHAAVFPPSRRDAEGTALVLAQAAASLDALNV